MPAAQPPPASRHTAALARGRSRPRPGAAGPSPRRSAAASLLIRPRRHGAARSPGSRRGRRVARQMLDDRVSLEHEPVRQRQAQPARTRCLAHATAAGSLPPRLAMSDASEALERTGGAERAGSITGTWLPASRFASQNLRISEVISARLTSRGLPGAPATCQPSGLPAHPGLPRCCRLHDRVPRTRRSRRPRARPPCQMLARPVRSAGPLQPGLSRSCGSCPR
jgi:hypothetical protein